MVSLRSKRKRVLIRRCTALLGVGALVGILLAVSSPVRTGATQPLTPPFSVYKNTIVDANGNPFFFRGAVSPSLGGSCIGDTVTNGPGPIPASDFTTMANTWGANAVTIYVNQDYWLYPATQLDTNNQPCTNYHSVVEQAISNAEAAGLVVILGSAFSQIGGSGPPQYHVPFCGSHTSNLPCLGQWCLPDAVYSVNAWQSLAQTFGNDPKVFFEPYSEPHDVSWEQVAQRRNDHLFVAALPVVHLSRCGNAATGECHPWNRGRKRHSCERPGVGAQSQPCPRGATAFWLCTDRRQRRIFRSQP